MQLDLSGWGRAVAGSNPVSPIDMKGRQEQAFRFLREVGHHAIGNPNDLALGADRQPVAGVAYGAAGPHMSRPPFTPQT